MWADVSSVLLQFMRLTDRQTDTYRETERSWLYTALHTMQHGKNIFVSKGQLKMQDRKMLDQFHIVI